MSADLKTFYLEDALDALIDYRGKTPKKTTSGIPLITAKIVKAGKILPTQEYIAVEDFKSWMVRGFPKSGDVVLTTEAPLGEVAQINELPVALAQRIVTLRGKPDLLLNDYLKYLLLSPQMQEKLHGRSSGSTVVGIKQSELRKVEVQLPSLGYQAKVARILKSLDNQIDNLEAQNTTIETIAQTLFRSWFVNFDPVQAKAAGQTPEGMSPELAALFPSEFVESELGMIPMGWSSPYMSDGFDFKEGPGIRNWQYTNSDEGTKFINIRCIQSGDLHLDTANRISDAEALGKYSHFLLKERDVVLSTSGTLGRTGLVRERHLPLCLNTSVIRFRQAELPMPFIKCFLESELFVNELNSLASGSVQKNFGPSHVKQIRYIKPTKNILEGFATVANPLFERLICNRDLSDTLVQLRDELLPRLISGKLSIEEAEGAVSEALSTYAAEEKAA